MVNERVGLLPIPARVKGEVQCPKCLSQKVRYSSSVTLFDGLLGVLAMRAMRCHSCYHKFHKMFG